MANNLVKYGITDKDKPESVENSEFQDSLAEFIQSQFDCAQRHKAAIGIESRLIRNLYAKKCEYAPDQASLIEADNNVYIGLCALKARALESWLTDIILNNIDKPWTLATTPIPALPERAKEQVLDMLVGELQFLTQLEDLRERAKELKTVALDQAKEIADKANAKMEQKITDQFADGNFKTMFTMLVQDISTYPAVFVRGPYEVSKLTAKWDGNAYSASESTLPDCRVVSPFDAYPSPTSTTPQDGEFFIERTRLLSSALYDCIDVKGFDEVNIRRALEEYETGYDMQISTDAARDRLEEQQQDTHESGNQIDTVIYNGLVPGKWLIEHKILVADPLKQYEAEVWKSGKYIVKAVLNPNKLGKRPIYSTSCIKVNRSIWGQSIIDVVYDTERICNAAARAATKNMAFSSGPIVEASQERMEGQDPTDLYPYKVFLVTPDLSGTGAPAIRFNVVDSVLPDLMSIFERFLKVADDLSGIPAYVLGNPQVAGAGRTMGGLSMLMGNAAKGVKNIQLNIDREIIGPVVEAFYVYNMQISKDDSIKADAQVIARGATGLMQRELAQARLVEILQLIVPLVPMWEQLPDGVKVILREIFKQTGLPIDDIIADPKQQEVLLDKIRELGQAESFGRGASNPVPLPGQSQPPMIPGLPNVNPRPMPLANAGPA